jgi:hypothetical protein
MPADSKIRGNRRIAGAAVPRMVAVGSCRSLSVVAIGGASGGPWRCFGTTVAPCLPVMLVPSINPGRRFPQRIGYPLEEPSRMITSERGVRAGGVVGPTRQLVEGVVWFWDRQGFKAPLRRPPTTVPSHGFVGIERGRPNLLWTRRTKHTKHIAPHFVRYCGSPVSEFGDTKGDRGVGGPGSHRGWDRTSSASPSCTH